MKKRNCLLSAAFLVGSMLLGQPAGQCMSLSLAEAVQLALVNSPDVAITQLGEETARATLRQARGNNSPAWSLSTSASRDWDATQPVSNSNHTGVSASLPLYTGGANQNKIKSGELGVDIAKLQTQRKWETTQLDVITGYYDCLSSKKAMAVAQDAVDKYVKHLENVEQLYKAGSKAKVDVLRSQVELADARQSLLKFSNAYDNAVTTLRNLLSLEQSEPIELTDDFSYEAFDTAMNDCVDYALANRKDLQVDEYRLQQQELAVKTAKAGYQPTVTLKVSTGWNKQVLPDNDNYSYGVSVNASWNIFDGGVTKGKVDSAETDYRIAQLTLQKDKQAVEKMLRQDYNSMREAEKRLDSTKEAVNEAQENFFIANEKYRAGEGIMLDIIDAQNALDTAQLNYISAQYDYATYKATVESDMGISVTPAVKPAGQEETAQQDNGQAAE